MIRMTVRSSRSARRCRLLISPVRKFRNPILGALLILTIFLATLVMLAPGQCFKVDTDNASDSLRVSDHGIIFSAKQRLDFSETTWFRSQERYSYDFNEILSPSGLQERLKFLFIVTSALPNSMNRANIRNTWGAKLKRTPDTELIFLLGIPSDREAERSILHESLINGDILQFSFIDSYSNLTTKSVLMLKWSQKLNPTFLVKIDDDVMLNVDTFFEVIGAAHALSEQFIAGHLFSEVEPIRHWWSKFYISRSEYADNIFPNYVAGLMYIISGNLIGALYEEALRTPAIKFEDLYVTGFLATRLAIPRLGLPGVDVFGAKSNCDIHTSLAKHLKTSDSMVELQRILDRTVRVCRRWYFGKRCICAEKFDKIIFL